MKNEWQEKFIALLLQTCGEKIAKSRGIFIFFCQVEYRG